MSQVPVQQGSQPSNQPSVQQSSHLTGLLVPLADRNLLLPNVAVAELITYRAPHPVVTGAGRGGRSDQTLDSVRPWIGRRRPPAMRSR